MCSQEYYRWVVYYYGNEETLNDMKKIGLNYIISAYETNMIDDLMTYENGEIRYQLRKLSSQEDVNSLMEELKDLENSSGCRCTVYKPEELISDREKLTEWIQRNREYIPEDN